MGIVANFDGPHHLRPKPSRLLAVLDVALGVVLLGGWLCLLLFGAELLRPIVEAR